MTNEPSPRPWHFNGMRPTIYSDEKLPDGSARVVLDIKTDHLPLLPCDENDRQLIADIELIVDAVNERDRLRDELDVERSQHQTDIEQAEYHAEHHRKILEAERDRLRDIVRRLIPAVEESFAIAKHEAESIKGICALKNVDSSEVDAVLSQWANLLQEARAAIGEEAAP